MLRSSAMFFAAAMLLAVSAIGLALAPPTTQKSIFDFDDDKPEAASVRPATQPVEGPTNIPIAVAPTTAPTSQPAAAATLGAKAIAASSLPVTLPKVIKAAVLPPVPDGKAQEEALRDIKEQFKTEYRAVGTERAAMAIKLMEAGTRDDVQPNARFVLLREARDMAAAAGAARISLAAARHLARRYSVDLTEMGLAVLMTAS